MSDYPQVLIQIRTYPWKKGGFTKGLVVQEDSVEKAFARIQFLYEELEKNDETRIMFYR